MVTASIYWSPGSRLWRLKYLFDTREKLLGLGHYPEVSLKEARERRDEARRLIAANVDPAEKRNAGPTIWIR